MALYKCCIIIIIIIIGTPSEEDRATATVNLHKKFGVKFGDVVFVRCADIQINSSTNSYSSQ